MKSLRSMRGAVGQSCSRFARNLSVKGSSVPQRSTLSAAATTPMSPFATAAARPKSSVEIDNRNRNPFAVQGIRAASIAPALVIVSCIFAAGALWLPLFVSLATRLAR